jgi:NTP pyrophosphatase (non-canonical NTP hydrolase)
MKNIMRYQEEFNKQHGWYWGDPKDEKERLNFLQFGIVALTGEVGEFANHLKKIMRENTYLKKELKPEDYENLKGELIDVFAYVLVLSQILNLDLEKEYYKKMEHNKERFKRFRKK